MSTELTQHSPYQMKTKDNQHVYLTCQHIITSGKLQGYPESSTGITALTD